MELDFKSLPELLNYFQDEDTCVEFLKKQRWNNKPVCPHCGSTKEHYENPLAELKKRKKQIESCT
ncbi:MAG: hypothetical protein EZS26_003846 [Candidatus Ordinivivax streblomastigis]|uniref:Transposase zinc-ribbon domain-containing protein n=1 Tax=Candidatus Ordinivivax streblomastigis TaxID=2540710 RepID=A0A5M8NX73_9BACT|nr:MAG: hypothetical protein EZS26_003846 [Candidatus Ordinivivax streblomastigis]